MNRSIESYLQEWLDASNQFDIETYINLYHKDATLEDSSVGEVFKGHTGIRAYFNEYFIGYNTSTRMVKSTVSGQKARIDAEFTGDTFKNLKGVFEITFERGKIKFVKAYLM